MFLAKSLRMMDDDQRQMTAKSDKRSGDGDCGGGDRGGGGGGDGGDEP